MLGRDSRLPLVGAQLNRLPSTWAAMWIDFHIVLLLLPVALFVKLEEDDHASTESSAAQKHEAERTGAAVRQATGLLTTGAAIFFVLACSSRAFAPTFAVFAVPPASVVAFSIFARLAECSAAADGSPVKRRPWRDVSSVAVNALRALCVFAAFMSVHAFPFIFTFTVTFTASRLPHFIS